MIELRDYILSMVFKNFIEKKFNILNGFIIDILRLMRMIEWYIMFLALFDLTSHFYFKLNLIMQILTSSDCLLSFSH